MLIIIIMFKIYLTLVKGKRGIIIMKGLKKIIAAVMAVCMMGVVLAGCGGSKDETTGATEATTVAVETEGTKEEASETTEEKTEAKTEAEDDDVEAGTNMSDAAQIGLEQEVAGTVESAGAAWYSFTTGPEDEMDYKVLLVNTTADDTEAVIEGSVLDEFGESVAGKYNYAYNDGTPCVMTIEKAKANTTYYISLTVSGYNNDTGYTVVVKPVE